jgi:hypothetical protein
MTDGVPGKWMKHWMAQYVTKQQAFPSFDNFNIELETSFLNSNLKQLEYQSIRKITWEPSKETLPEFFTRFEISAGHAEYLRNDQELIHFLKRKFPHIITNN